MRYINLLVLFIVSGCVHSPANKTMPVTFDKQGHRGCRSLMPENTIPAMIKAIDLAVNTLEMDIVITKDKRLILSHEPFFNHEITTKPDGKFVAESEERSLNIYGMTYEETRKYDVGSKPHPRFPGQQKIKVSKPLLSDLIDSVEMYCKQKNLKKINYNIETKTQPLTDNIYHPAPQEFVDLLINIILLKRIEKRVTIQSFDFRTLQYVHRKYPLIKTAMLIEEDDKRAFDQQLKELGFIPSVYSPHFSLVTKNIIKACHEKNILVIPWTVDELEKMKDLKQIGADGIISDDPSLFKRLL
ncbi:MAG: glycerophosphodiester phosphodiesterase family protein [Ginsengibacter sp.]